MKIGVVIPVAGGSAGADDRTIDSALLAFSAADVDGLVVVVGDGYGPDPRSRSGAVVRFDLPVPALDAGATPRSIGAAYALGQGCDVIAFLDDGNTYDPTHLVNAVQCIQRGAEVVTSLRWMMSLTEEPLYVDTQDSDGATFADTNTIVLGGRAAKFATTFSWFAEPSGTDRIFWDRLTRSFGDAIVCTGQPTALYETEWAAHYSVANEDGTPRFTPPNPAKFVRLKPDGTRYAMRGEPKWTGTCWVAKEDGRP